MWFISRGGNFKFLAKTKYSISDPSKLKAFADHKIMLLHCCKSSFEGWKTSCEKDQKKEMLFTGNLLFCYPIFTMIYSRTFVGKHSFIWFVVSFRSWKNSIKLECNGFCKMFVTTIAANSKQSGC